MARKMTPEKIKEYWDVVERIIASMPKEAGEVCRKVAQEIVDNDGDLDGEELSKKFSDAFQNAMEAAKPMKTIKLKPRVAKQVKDDKVWLESQRKRLKRLEEQNAKLVADARAMKNEIIDRKEKLNALVVVEHGVSAKHTAFRINEETLELEIMMEDKVMAAEAAKAGFSL